MLIYEEIGPLGFERGQLDLFIDVPVTPLPFQVLRVFSVEAQVLVKGDACILHQLLLAVGLPLPIDRIKFSLET